VNGHVKGVVGLELRARGFSVELDVYSDDEFLEVEASIVVAGTAADAHSEIRVSDDGNIKWNCCYLAPEYAVIAWEPEYSISLKHEIIARDVARKVAGAMSIPEPGRTSRRAAR
jgi:hypothetical protein